MSRLNCSIVAFMGEFWKWRWCVYMLNSCSKIGPPLRQDNIPDNFLHIYCAVSYPDPPGNMRELRSRTWLPWTKWENGEAKHSCVGFSEQMSCFCVFPPLLRPVLVSLPPRWMLSGSLMMPVSPHWLWLQQQFTCRAEDRRAVKLTSLFMLEHCVIIPT